MKLTDKPWLKVGLLALITVGLFLVLRFYKLLSLPVFVDESIYIRWSQVMRAEPTLRFLPLSDGKQPLFMWLVIPALKLFRDPVFAGRTISVVAGFATLAAVFLLTRRYTKKNDWALVAALIYAIFPFAVFFDRMALADGLLSMFGVWAFLLGLLLVENLRLDLAMLLGFAVGGAVLTKSPGWFFLLLQPALIFWRPKWQQLDWFKLFGGWLVAAIIAVGMYNILRLGPNFQLVAQRNLDYVFSPNEVLQHPLNPFIGNIKNTLAWLMNLITPVGLILAFASILGRERKQVSLWVWIILPLLAQAAVAKVYTSRYFFYVIPYLAILAALGWRELQQRQRTLAVFLAALFISQCLVYGWTMVTNPARARMPQNMAHGYLQEWTAGWGQKEVADYLIERAKTHTVVVGTEGFFGTLPDGLQIYTEKVPNLTVIGVGLNVSAIPESLKQALVENEVYLVINKDRHSLKEIPPEKRKLLLSFPKPSRPNGSNEELDFYQLFL